MSSDTRLLDRDFRPIVEELVAALKEAGINVRITSTLRSRAEQTALFNAAQRGQSKYPAAPPGTSVHEHGLAVDLATTDPRHLQVVGRVWESLAAAGLVGRWGGRFSRPDPIHFEARIPTWMADYRKKYGHLPPFEAPLEAKDPIGSVLIPWWASWIPLPKG